MILPKFNNQNLFISLDKSACQSYYKIKTLPTTVKVLNQESLVKYVPAV